MNKEERKEARKGWTFVLFAAALLLKLVLAAFDISISQSAIDQGINLILGAAATFGAFRNNYVGKLGKAQYRLLHNSDMQHFFKKFTKEDE